MSWISKAENLLNKIDQSANGLLQQQAKDDSAPLLMTKSGSKVNQSSRAALKVSSAASLSFVENEDRWDSKSWKSEKSSISSKHETVIDNQWENQKSFVNDGNAMPKTSSNASLNINFSAEKELAATKILAAELRSENQELKHEMESLIDQMKVNGNQMKMQELEELCESLIEEKKSVTEMWVSSSSANINTKSQSVLTCILDYNPSKAPTPTMSRRYQNWRRL